MKIDIAKADLQPLRDILYLSINDVPKRREALANKIIRKVNSALKKIHGHDCCGDAYLPQLPDRESE